MELREYQKEILGKIRHEFAKGNNRVIAQLPTGAGKTVVFTEIAKRTIMRGNSVLVITNRKELLQQAGNTFKKFELMPEFLTSKTKILSSGHLYVGMSETIKRRLHRKDYVSFLNRFTLIIIDEVHLQNFDKLYETINNNQFLLGVTATPYRKGNKINPLSKFFDVLIEGIKIKQLIDLGYLSKPKVYGMPIDLSKVKLKNGEFDPNEIDKLYEEKKVYAGVIDNYKRLTPNTKALLFSAKVETSLKICEKLNNAGISAKHIDATTKERDQILKEFTQNKFKILCNVGILTFGYDCPSVETIILYRATMSLPLYLQMCGRGSRIYPGKEHFNILDFGDNVKRFDFWHSERPWKLDLMSKPKKKGAAPIKQCPECEALIPANSQTCPECGFIFKNPEDEKPKIFAKLELLTYSEISRYAKTATVKELIEIQKTKGYNSYWVCHQLKTFKELQEYGEIKGYKKGWAYHNRKRFNI